MNIEKGLIVIWLKSLRINYFKWFYWKYIKLGRLGLPTPDVIHLINGKHRFGFKIENRPQKWLIQEVSKSEQAKCFDSFCWLWIEFPSDTPKCNLITGEVIFS